LIAILLTVTPFAPAQAPEAVPAAIGGHTAAAFASPGRYGVGSNLIVPVPLSSPSNTSTILYVSKAVPTTGRNTNSSSVQRLLGARNSNWLLGYWNADSPGGPWQDRAYAPAPGTPVD
jgi:hypothetical protein